MYDVYVRAPRGVVHERPNAKECVMAPSEVSDLYKRKPYVKKIDIDGNVPRVRGKSHIGQHKLLVGYYLLRFKLQDFAPKTILYIGSAPGTSLLEGQALFPGATWTLIDPRSHDPMVLLWARHCGHKVLQQKCTEEWCREQDAFDGS